MGADHIVSNMAMDPGVVYNAAPRDYVSLLCSMNFTRNQIMTIMRSNDDDCANYSSLDLNYPSFVAFYDRNITTRVMLTHCFRRVVMNSLVFGKKYEWRDYFVEITYASNSEGMVSYGSIVWIEENGKHILRSPIVVAPTSAGQ
ncbi:unnamed protein product [Linum trigynum]|uniref:Subtilisin-like protease fibronectin type-III domain-containing protein n=1 Tax=Linum trigynum TaxID=586398 RepID=A0AAV2GJM0_9ROSI